MDLLLICRDALASSLISNLVLAMEAKKAGEDVAVLFTEEALAAAAGGTFSMPRELSGQELRLKMTDNASALGMPTMGGKGDGRQIDARKMIARAKEAGVSMLACPTWTGLLGLKGKRMEGIKELDLTEALRILREAKTVIGSF